MRKPKLLDLFCGAGGCSVGYNRAGFDVVGVDINPQPHYPFEFHQADAMAFPLDGFDAVHASPPCQKYSRLAYLHPEIDYPDLVAPVRERLKQSGVPFVIENVPDAPLINAITLCGTMFNLRVLRHRKFESNFLIMLPGACNHWGRMAPSKGCYHTLENYDFITCAGHNYKRSDGALAMGIDWWVTREELSEAIPPAYTEYIGKQLRAHVVCAEGVVCFHVQGNFGLKKTLEKDEEHNGASCATESGRKKNAAEAENTAHNSAMVLCPACKYGAPCQVGFAGTCGIRPCKLAQHQ